MIMKLNIAICYKPSRLCTKHTIHRKAFAVYKAHAIIYCTRQVVQGENFRDWLKNRKSFAVYGNYHEYHGINRISTLVNLGFVCYKILSGFKCSTKLSGSTVQTKY